MNFENEYLNPEDETVRLSKTLSYVLEDGEKSNEKHPDTFEIPDRYSRHTLKKNDIVKLIFRIIRSGVKDDGSQWGNLVDGNLVNTERMWVVVDRETENGYIGKLDNQAATAPSELHLGLEVFFEPRHIVSIWET